jgi:farnesyl-diphosphate farnesyltransferase
MSFRPVPENDAISWSHDAVAAVSRTFAITIDLLEEPMSSYVCVGYLLCRIPDTIEDAKHVPGSEKDRLLSCYEDVLDPSDPTTPEAFRDAALAFEPDDPESPADWEVVKETPRVVAAYRLLDDDVQAAMRPPVRELVDGMREYVGRGEEEGLRIETAEELDEYCYYVAGTVGHLITNLVALDTSSDSEAYLRERAEAFGLLLQLVNISKDVHDDYQSEGSVFLPREWLAVHDVPQDDVLSPDHRDGARATVTRTIEHARSYLDDAHEWLHRLDAERSQDTPAWALPYLLAVATLRELEGNVDRVFTDQPVKVSREEVFALIETCTTGDVDLDALRRRVAARPFHD